MKLLYVVHQYFPECRSGTEQYCHAIAREARQRGDRVVILSLEPDFGTPLPTIHLYDRGYDGFSVLRLRHHWALQPGELLRDYHNPLVAARFEVLLDELRPDAIHFFHLRRLGSDLLETAHRLGVRSIVHLMDFWFLCPRFTLLRADGVLCDGPPEGGAGCIGCAVRDLGERTLVEPDPPPARPAGAPPAADGSRAAAAAGAARPSAWTQPSSAAAARAFARALEPLPPAPGDRPADRFRALLGRKGEQLRRLALADVVFAPSRFLAEMFAHNGFRARALQVVPYGLAAGVVERASVDRPRRPLRVAFAGVLSPWKAPHVAVRAVRRLDAGRDGGVELAVRGNTEERMFREYVRELRSLAAGDPRIRFPGPFGRAELGRVLADTDVLVVPSLWYENTPFVILEAFAAGVPVLASDLGGIREVVEPGVDGFLFPPGDDAALAKLLRALLAQPERLRALEPRSVPTTADNYDVFRRAYRGGASGGDAAGSAGELRGQA